MEATKHRAIIKNNRLLIDLPKNFNNSEVEVFIIKIKNAIHKGNALKRFLAHSVNVDNSIPYPDREERNAR
jgi:hypothetical protein